MRWTNRWLITALVAVLAPNLLVGPSAAQAPGGSDGSAPGSGAASAPIIMKVLTADVRVSADGLYTERVHWELTPTNSSAANSAGQQSFGYSAALEDVQVSEAYTLKSDGRRLNVEPSQIFDQLPQGAPQVPLFNDQRRKVIVYPDVAANDTLVLTYVKRALKSVFPGQFTDSDVFPRTLAWNEVRETIVAPKDFPLTVEAHEVEFRREVGQNEVTYAWHLSAPNPLTDDVAAVSPYDREPRLFASSFKSYDDLARAYAALAEPKAAVTSNVRALADQIVGAESNRRRQAEKIYEWVSSHIRYVAVELGQGAVIPHDADTVITDRYGDCKDHVVLFSALLAAKGIASEMVLVNLGNSYTLSGPPTLSQLNHAITWIPEFGTYADTTAAVAPFGTLPFDEYGKPAVHAVTTGRALRTMPLLSPGQASVNLTSITHLNADGTMSGRTTTTATGPFAIVLRQFGRVVEENGAERVLEAMIARGGGSGTGKFDVPASGDLGRSYTVSAQFDVRPRVPFVTGQGFPMPPGIRLLGFPGDNLMGPLYNGRLSAREPTPCWSGTQVEDLSIEPPPGNHFAALPADTKVSTDNLTFSAHWSQSGRIVSVRREFTSRMEQPLCSGKIRAETAAALPQIAAAYPLQLVFEADQ